MATDKLCPRHSVVVQETRRRMQPVARKFVVRKGTTGKFRVNLLSANGQVVATSEAQPRQ